ncbi:MAG: inositol monophosphatase [Thermoplasmata archaeon]|nr:inositol monophosphatase [Thermoplasmata archaeon]MBR4686427.1 inositol monophosphatase [Candidatus Methanomethylophilaceae archaeon]
MTGELKVLTDAIRKASEIVLNGDRSAKDKSTVIGMYDVVTGSDILAEQSIIKDITAAFPEDTIISEETNPDKELSERCWTIDPIDGTMNYSRGIPFFGIQGCFMENGEAKASAIYLPVFDEMFTADENGAYLNGERIHTCEPRPLKQCLVSTGDFSRRSQEFRDAQAAIFHDCYSDIARFKVFGASSVDYTYLAAGRIDVHVRFLNKIWDFKPGMHIAEKAGAVYDHGLADEHGILVMCSSQEVLEEAVGTLVPKFISIFRRA